MSNLVQFNLRRKSSIFNTGPGCVEQGRQRGGRAQVRGRMALYLNTCISSGELRTSSWRRRQRRQARSSCCSRASWGASCLGHRHTNTCAQNSVTVVLVRGQGSPWSSWLCFRDHGPDGLPAAPHAPQKSQGPEEPLRSSNKEPAARSPAACLRGAPWSQNLPLPSPGEKRLP